MSKQFESVLSGVTRKPERKVLMGRIKKELHEKFAQEAKRRDISEAKLLEAVLIWFFEVNEKSK